MSETLVEQSHQLNISGHNVSFGTRGIALTGSGHAGTEDPLHDTDYTATCLGKSSVSELVRNFDEPLPDSGVVCSQLETDLRRAVDRQEFRVFFQPICSLDTGGIMGFEALVRWQHPARGLLSPVDFLQATEETGLIVPIGLWVLREASRQMHRWHLRFSDNPPLHLSVNISSKQFQQPDLVEQISQILDETGLNPASLKLEITETLVMQNSESARNILLQLRALNVKLAIDDFGTGYSSLSYLQKFPVHTLKIDRSFISKLQDAKESLEIVRAVVTLAHNLGLDVIAEGIETANHLAMLKILKCEFGQGYFYSKPVDMEHAEALIVRATQAQFAMSATDAAEEKAPEQCEVGNANQVCVGQYPSPVSSSLMLNSTELVKSVKVHFDNRDDEALKEMITLASDPVLRSLEGGTNPDEAPGSQDQRLREEFEIHIENLKREAIKQFDQELYTVCLGTFQFLCELEPDDRTLCDYLELCQQLVSETETEEARAVTTASDASPIETLDLVPATERNASVTKRGRGEPIAPTFGNEAGLDDRQESNQSSRSIADQVNRPRDVDGQADGVLKAREDKLEATSILRNKRRFALLVTAAAVLFGVILGVWTHRQRENLIVSSVVQLDKTSAPVDRQSELSKLEATAQSLYEQGNLQEANSRCDDILQRDPQNAFALDLKKAIRTHDIPAARLDNLAPKNHERTQEERASTAGVSASQPKELPAVGGVRSATSKNVVRKLDSKVLLYSVIHEHFLGSCRGNLKVSGESIVFEPSEDSRHGFVFKLTDIVGTELGDTLKIKFKHDTYRFKAASFARNKGDNGSKLAAIDQRLTRVRAELAREKH